MKCKFNKFKSITKGLMGQNIIFPAAYILFSANANGCDWGMSSKSNASNPTSKTEASDIPSIPSATVEANGSQASDGDRGVTSLAGRGTVLSLGDSCPYGFFVPSESKEVFIIKLPSKGEGGWMQFMKQAPQDSQGVQTGRLSMRYDAVQEPRIIKVDASILKLLLEQSGQSPSIDEASIDKEDLLHKLTNGPSWRDIEFFYKEPVTGLRIFREGDITASTKVTKVLDQKFSRTNHLTSSTLSISGNIASDTLQDLEKVGFLLIKDKSGLVDAIKNMLEGDAEWATTAVIADAKGYITCPGSLDGDLLKFDSSDLKLSLEENVRLEDYDTTCCYLKDGAYHCLRTLDNVEFLKKRYQEPYIASSYYSNPITQGSENKTAAIPKSEDGVAIDQSNELPLTQPGWMLNSSQVNDEDTTDADQNRVNDGEESYQQTLLGPDSPEEGPTQNSNDHKPLTTSPRQYTVSSVPIPPPPPMPMPNNVVSPGNSGSKAELLKQIREGKKLKQVNKTGIKAVSPGNSGPEKDKQSMSNGSGSGPATPPPPPPPTSTGSRTNSGSVPPPPPPPMPAQEQLNASGLGSSSPAKGGKPISKGSGSGSATPQGGDNTMMDELKQKLEKRKKQSTESSISSESIDNQVEAKRNSKPQTQDSMIASINKAIDKHASDKNEMSEKMSERREAMGFKDSKDESDDKGDNNNDNGGENDDWD